MKNYGNLILENFGGFLQENSALFEEASSSVSVLTDQLYYESYTDKLLTGFEESDKAFFKGLFDRQRAVILEEGTTMLGSPEAISYSVTSFPMILDIYAEPLLSKVVTVYPSDKPIMSIPRLKWTAKIMGLDGKTEEIIYFPTATKMVRPGLVDVATPAGKTKVNLFDVASIPAAKKSEYRINKRNFKVTKVTCKVGDGSASDALFSEEVVIITDARGNFEEDLMVSNADGSVTYDFIRIQGTVNFEKGEMTYSFVNMSDDATEQALVISPVSLQVRTRIFGVGNGAGVIKARPEMGNIDINADVEDTFEIENIEEIIQDWKSLYNLDIIAQLKEFVKDQMRLNKDFEIADLLYTNIPAAKRFGHYAEIDFGDVITSTNPRTFADIFKSILPVFIMLQETIRKNTRLEVSYVVTSVRVAAILKSLQEFTMKLAGAVGEMGMSGSIGDFGKLEIVTSFAVEDDYIYLVTKSETLSQSTLVEVTHKPFYVIKEVTNSIARTFIKSRNWIGIVRPEGIGCIKVKGIHGLKLNEAASGTGLKLFGTITAPTVQPGA